MDAMQTLADLGFGDATVVAEKKDVLTVRIRTAKGWTYERFRKDDERAVRAWAVNHSPG